MKKIVLFVLPALIIVFISFFIYSNHTTTLQEVISKQEKTNQSSIESLSITGKNQEEFAVISNKKIIDEILSNDVELKKVRKINENHGDFYMINIRYKNEAKRLTFMVFSNYITLEPEPSLKYKVIGNNHLFNIIDSEDFQWDNE